MATQPQTPRWRSAKIASKRGTATFEVVLKVSTRLFSERGYAATTMRQLAEEADLPISAFYYYFSRKYDVLLGIFDAVLTDSERVISEAVDPDASPDAQLAAIVGTHVRYHLANPHEARVVDRELRSLTKTDLAAALRRRDAYEQPFRDALVRGAEAGVFRKDLDVVVAKNLIMTMSTGVIDWWRPRGRLTPDEIAKLIGEFAVSLARNG